MAWQSTLKVSVSGVRGIVGDSLTMQLGASFATAFGTYVGKGKVIIGRDTRPTGLMLQNAIVSGLLSVGCEPVLCDVLPTPSILMLVDELKAKGGICITASHNPNEWNAMKFVGPDGLFLNSTEAVELLDLYNQEAYEYVPENEIRKVSTLENPFDCHKQRVFKHIDLEKIRAANFTVAVDCCNGAGALFSKDFLEELGCKVIAINDTDDGIFTRGPEPIPENLIDLCTAVREHNCIVGFAQDPDCDRLAMVDGNGDTIGENTTLTLAVDHILSHKKGYVVTNLSSSKAIEDITKRHGCELFYSKIGEINVTEKMLKCDAVIGGEGNGGVIWPAVHPCRDSYTAMALTLEMLAERQQSLVEIMKNTPRYDTANFKMTCTLERAQRIIRTLREQFVEQRQSNLDGLRIDWDDRWVLVRPSNTEPIIRVGAEAPSQDEADELAREFLQKCKGIL
ncbi:MAG: phosphoglucosamine mutase [Lentisphaeria bacterium]|nr:phosphoglucosamine mutase [Lentisphaeria bacterium]NQZ69074.1 phosphoglucosamine mutase [Lentisphaeria bacterium]